MTYRCLTAHVAVLTDISAARTLSVKQGQVGFARITARGIHHPMQAQFTNAVTDVPRRGTLTGFMALLPDQGAVGHVTAEECTACAARRSAIRFEMTRNRTRARAGSVLAKFRLLATTRPSTLADKSRARFKS